ncbi:kinase-like domain-containing protein [Ilyonectria robusta]|uniref:kinase-like domain-containing protein n=1 Tax=Ilyonectria robusta TaxID=1079257 RepID=UPI001E8DAE9D|nr:kinase-like domain-containing protein [Ilyonectria robusta]KAH8683728.1 kinase-like domain-containing protein [Ilyonectria robusta]
MQQVGLGVGITAVAFETGRLVKEIGKMIRDFRGNRARDRCAKLQVEAEKLNRLLHIMPGAVNNSVGIANEAQSCMADIKDYTDRMANSGMLDDAVEVWWQRRYDIILARTRRVSEALTVGLLARTDFNPLGRLGTDGRVRPVSPITIADPTVITFDDARSTGYGIIEGHGHVVFRRLKDSQYSLEALDLYQRLQERSYVQQLRGLTEVEGQVYVVMQDCSSHKTLNKLCAEEKLPLDLPSRIEIAWHLARTFAWHHRSYILVKAASDESIFMKRANQTFIPILTGLEHMRSLYELSTGLRFDCRYEAPEYDTKETEHTLYTDRWCLGILVWQVICERFPHGIKYPVDFDNQDDTQKIRDRLKKNIEPGEFPAGPALPSELVSELRACWNTNPEERPTPTRVASVLSDTLLRLKRNRDELLALTQQPDPDMLGEGSSEAARRQVASRVNQERKAHSAREKQERKARRKKKNKLKDNRQPNGKEKIPADIIKPLLRATDAECAYLVGASIWWDLLDEKTLKLLASSRVSDYLTTTTSGQRAELSLTFLHQAVRGGCVDGYLEMHKAYALLSELCMENHTKALEAKGSQSADLTD